MGLGEVFKLFATLGIDATDFDRGLAGAEQRLNATSQAFSGAGRALTMGVTAPIVGVGTAALHSSITFESAFAGVRKTVDATEEEFAALERGIRDMSARIPASAEAIAQVAEAAGQLGIQTGNILGFTEVMIGLGESTNMSADEAATNLARFANIVQMPQENFDRLGSTIVDLGNNLATTEGEITEMALRLAGSGELIGLTEAEILGVAGALSSVGIRAEAGGTALSRVMKDMMTAVAGGGEELDKFATAAGMSSEEFAEAFQNRPAEAINAFVTGLGRISAEGGNVIGTLEGLKLNDIRVSDALLRMAGAGDVLTNSLGLATTAWEENTALGEEVGRRYETTESQLTVLKNTLQEVVRTIGDGLVPMLMAVLEAAKPLLGALQSLAEWFANLDPGMQAVIVGAAGIAAAIGPLLWMIGSFAGAVSNLLPILRFVPGAFTAIRTAIGLLTGPVGWIITAIGLIATAWATDFLGLRTNFEENWGKIRGILDAVVTFFSERLDRLIETVKDWWADMTEFFTGLPEKMLGFGKDLIGGLVDGVKSMVTGAVDAVKGVGESVISGFKGLLGIESPSKVFHQFGVDIGEGLAQGIESTEGRVLGAVADIARAATTESAFGSRAAGSFGSGAWLDGIAGDLEGRERLNALRREQRRLEEQRRLTFGHGIGVGNFSRGLIDLKADTLEDAIRELTAESKRARAEQSRAGEAQTRRFSMAVGTFDTGVRGLQLARQRY